jgi:hypothetical protein
LSQVAPCSFNVVAPAKAARDTRPWYTPAVEREEAFGPRALVVRSCEVDEEHRLAVNLATSASKRTGRSSTSSGVAPVLPGPIA